MRDIQQNKETVVNARGIPVAPFIDKVEDYVSSRSEVDTTMKNFQEMIAKYQFMEVSTQKRKIGLNEKIPDIAKTIDAVQFLKDQKQASTSIDTVFELNDTLLARATVPPTHEVYLWLGANVMLAYSIDEAGILLESKLAAAQQALVNCVEDLDFLREQVTTLEVATARVYNWDVTMRRQESANVNFDPKVATKNLQHKA